MAISGVREVARIVGLNVVTIYQDVVMENKNIVKDLKKWHED